jgi:hypothetical protein
MSPILKHHNNRQLGITFLKLGETMFNKLAQSFLIVVMAVLFASTAHAALLGSMSHNYKSMWGSYITLNEFATPAFSDSFDLSGMDIGSVDRFELTLTFAETNRPSVIPGLATTVDPEDWRLRPGGSTTAYLDMNLVGFSSAAQTFVMDDAIDTFQSMVDNANFFFWFAELARNGTPYGDEFKLYSANLDVYGTDSSAATPIPGAVWLLGSGLVGLVGLRRRMRG